MTAILTLAVTGLATSCRPLRIGPGLRNDCRAALPDALAHHPLIAAAWDGIDPGAVWDSHVHLVGTGDSGSGIRVNAAMASPLNPRLYAQYLFYLNASCVHDAPGRIDASYLARLCNLIDGMRPGFKAMLFAFDAALGDDGAPNQAATMFEVPNDHVARVVREFPDYFEWVASVHPYRTDALERVRAAAAAGARALKWLPNAMLIDPASPRCDRFYALLAQLGLPLITHGGHEIAVHSPLGQAFGNPLRLRRALDAGVTVIVAHCASLGVDVDLDQGPQGPAVASFDLFARLIDEPRYQGRLYGDVSAVTLRNRDLSILRRLLEREDWHSRLINGSDYPLPGIVPLISIAGLADDGLLDVAAVPVLTEIREHNPLLFDFILKRNLGWQGRRWPASVFMTRPLFLRRTGNVV